MACRVFVFLLRSPGVIQRFCPLEHLLPVSSGTPLHPNRFPGLAPQAGPRSIFPTCSQQAPSVSMPRPIFNRASLRLQLVPAAADRGARRSRPGPRSRAGRGNQPRPIARRNHRPPPGSTGRRAKPPLTSSASQRPPRGLQSGTGRIAPPLRPARPGSRLRLLSLHAPVSARSQAALLFPAPQLGKRRRSSLSDARGGS